MPKETRISKIEGEIIEEPSRDKTGHRSQQTIDEARVNAGRRDAEDELRDLDAAEHPEEP